MSAPAVAPAAVEAIGPSCPNCRSEMVRDTDRRTGRPYDRCYGCGHVAYAERSRAGAAPAVQVPELELVPRGEEVDEGEADAGLPLGERLRRARERRGLTKSAAADALGVTFKTYSRWEDGTAPRARYFDVILQVLGVVVVDHEAGIEGAEEAADESREVPLRGESFVAAAIEETKQIERFTALVELPSVPNPAPVPAAAPAVVPLPEVVLDLGEFDGDGMAAAALRRQLRDCGYRVVFTVRAMRTRLTRLEAELLAGMDP